MGHVLIKAWILAAKPEQKTPPALLAGLLQALARGANGAPAGRL